jgi:hypothetical protein
LEQISLVLNEAGGVVEAEEQPGDRPKSSLQPQPNDVLVATRQSVPSKAASQVKQSPEFEKPHDSSRDN